MSLSFVFLTTENSACTTAGTDVTIDTLYTHLGSSSNTKYIAVYTLPIKVPCNVDIAAWDIRYSGPCDLAMQVWTSVNGETDQFQLFGQNNGTLPDPNVLTDIIGRISVSSQQQIRLTANQTYYFGLTSFGSSCLIDDSSGSYSLSYATGGDLTRSVGNTLTSFSSTETHKAAYFRAILKGELVALKFNDHKEKQNNNKRRIFSYPTTPHDTGIRRSVVLYCGNAKTPNRGQPSWSDIVQNCIKVIRR